MLVHFPVLLVVDDDQDLLRTLRLNFEADGFDVLTAASGREALEKLQRKLPDLAIVDLMLPDIHGFDLCRRIKSSLEVPILMLTAVGSEESVVSGLNLYAEDYVVKPFSYKELLARVNRVLKRTKNLLPPQTLAVDEGLSLDFARRVAKIGDSEIKLTPVESRIMAILARNANKVVSTEALLDEAWPDGEGDVNRLWVNIGRLRSKIETNPDKPVHIITERGLGYKLSLKN